ncbi:hypothetical protein GJQ54_10430 [Oceanospirillaceae bacterium ASx5O]|nr:hypothetical protein GJQ54_10430 [Oceanospirillaceae bacterium ASx5O]
MQKRPSKNTVREQLSQEVEDFLLHGGAVTEVPRGASGLQDGRYGQPVAFDKPREERTPVSDVLKVIDQRREEQRKTHKPATSKKPKRPRKKVIYDDFGEPVRVVWEE